MVEIPKRQLQNEGRILVEFRDRALKKQYSKLKDEFDGMDQMASITPLNL